MVLQTLKKNHFKAYFMIIYNKEYEKTQTNHYKGKFSLK